MTTKEQLAEITARLDKHDSDFTEVRAAIKDLSGVVSTLTGSVNTLSSVVNTLAASIVSHDNQIEALIKGAAEDRKRWRNLESSGRPT